MASATRRFGGPIIGFLIGGGLEISGFEDMRVAIFLWSIAGVWGLIALFTWEPVLRVFRNIRRIRIIIVNSNSSKRKRKEVGSVGEKGFLNHRVAVLEDIPRMNKIINKYTMDTEKFSQRIESRAKYAQKTQDAIKLRKHASKLANDIEHHSKTTEEYIREYKHLNSVFDESYIQLIKMGDHKESYKSVQGFFEVIQKTRQSLQFLHDKTLGLGSISQDLNRASRLLAASLENLINEMKHTESFCKRALSILE